MQSVADPAIFSNGGALFCHNGGAQFYPVFQVKSWSWNFNMKWGLAMGGSSDASSIASLLSPASKSVRSITTLFARIYPK